MSVFKYRLQKCYLHLVQFQRRYSSSSTSPVKIVISQLLPSTHDVISNTFWQDVRQRWSRGRKARGQGHKKNPRPRTALLRTDLLEAKNRNARCQGPRKQAQVFSKEKKNVFKKVFQAISKKKINPICTGGGGKFAPLLVILILLLNERKVLL